MTMPVVPKAAVFDLGKVLLDFDYRVFARYLATEAEASPAEILSQVVGSNLLREYEYGRISSKSFFERVRALSGYRGDFVAFCDCFGKIFTAMPEMIAAQERLKQSGISTFIFSNTNAIAIGAIREQFAFYGGFDGWALSFDHGFMKPEAGFYEVVEQMAGRSGADIVFIDDREENIAAAQARGWRGIIHASPETTLQSLRAAGLPV